MTPSAANHEAYHHAVEFLYGLRLFGAKFGLENSLKLAALAGNPHEKLRFIHVAGTNGKGSTCAILESVYRAAGLRVGLFTSPHLVSFRERIQINRQIISEVDVVRFVGEFKPWLSEFPADHHPTFFEVVTVMALKYFAGQKCDLVIWETGLGGRLDATNIVTPLASVITNIGLEHQHWLGDTLEKIAAEKAGIIKPNVPALTAEQKPGPLGVIEKIARERNAPLTTVAVDGNSSLTKFAALRRDAATLPLPGEHQKLNAALALATVGVLQKQIPVSEKQIRDGLQNVNWPGRMQLVARSSGQKILLDGAHNPDGAEVLRRALETEFPNARPAMIFGVFRDKDSSAMCHLLAPIASRILLAPVHSERSENPENLVAACSEANPPAKIEVCASLAEALEKTAREPFVVIAGSLYLVGEAMELLRVSPVPDSDEKGLNEWPAGKNETR
jgi:dihydrofolate synthase/folylpolyglutamate synthase